MNRKSLGVLVVAGVAASMLGAEQATAADTQFGAEVSVWDSGLPPDPVNGIFPIGGAGQRNGDFVVTKEDGVEIGIRARRCAEPGGGQTGEPRPSTTQGEGGVYTMVASPADLFGAAAWDVDVHLDLTAARGAAAGTTLADYDVELVTDVGGHEESIDLGTTSPLPANTVLFQTSRDPLFGATPFELLTSDGYSIELRLRPRSFEGDMMKARMDVRVLDS